MIDVRRADLHTHTYYSDGCLSPAALVQKAHQCGLRALSITDHDCVDGLEEGLQAGALYGVEMVAGVELSVTLEESRLHLLGYFFDPNHAELRAHLEEFRRLRRVRAERMLERLADLGVFLSLASLQAPGRAVGRPHVAEAMVAAGVVETTQEAFERYLADGKPAHVSKPLFPASEALAMLHAAGGIGVLAHPGHHTAGDTITALVRDGLDGLETIHPSHDAELTQYYRQLARDMNLLETGGSDFHRPAPTEKIGLVSIPYPWLATARSWRRQP